MSLRLLAIELRVNLEYIDSKRHCKRSAIEPPFTLIVKIQNSIPISAYLNGYRFNQQELNGLEIITELDFAWLKQLTLYTNIFNMLVFTGKEGSYPTCVPPKDIVFDLKNPIIDFGVTSVGYLLPKMINSDTHFIHGKNKEKEDCQIKLSLLQIRQ